MDEKTAARCVEAVLSDLMDRAGFDAWWDSIDAETQQEIRDTLARVVTTAARDGK